MKKLSTLLLLIVLGLSGWLGVQAAGLLSGEAGGPSEPSTVATDSGTENVSVQCASYGA